MRFFWVLAIVFASHTVFSQDANVWQKVLKTTETNFVNIEYYEEINSPESISNGNKVARRLNGVVVDKNGLIMTSAAIYRTRMDFSASSQYGPENPPDDIKVTFKDQEAIDAEFVGKDDDKGIAFIRIKTDQIYNHVKFTEKKMGIGEPLFIAYQLGDEYNQQFVVLEKKINGILAGPPQKLLTDLSSEIFFALAFNAKGEPCGVLLNDNFVAYHGYNYPVNPPAFAEILLPDGFISLIKSPPEYRKKETVRKKWLGVNMQPFTRSLARYFNEKDLNGILINTVVDDSPAKKAGIAAGDVLLAFNGTKLSAEKDTDMQIFRNLVRESDGDNAEVKIWRKGKTEELSIKLAETPMSQYLADESSNELLGFSAKELTKDIIMAKQLDFDTDGVWVSRVERAGWADLAGLQVGDLLLKVDNHDLHNLEELNIFFGRFETEKPQYVTFFVKRRTETRFLFIKTNF